VTSFFEIKVGVFLKNDKTALRQFFSGFTRKHLFITTCNEKHCTRPLSINPSHIEVCKAGKKTEVLII